MFSSLCPQTQKENGRLSLGEQKFIMSMKNVTVLMQFLNDSIICYGSFDFLYENATQCPKRHMLLTACIAVLSLRQLAN